MGMPPLFWGLLVSPLWGAMFFLSGTLLAAMGVPWGYLVEGLAMVAATLIIGRIDAGMRRPGVPEIGLRLPPTPWILAALLAGVGAAILGSEIDNIVRDRVPLVTAALDPHAPPPGPTLTPGPAWLQGLSYGLVAPICLAFLGLGITMRNLWTSIPGWAALTIGALATAWSRHEHPAYWLPWMLGPLIGGWAYARTHSIWLGVAALLPQHAVVWLTVLAIQPGIPGFDTAPRPVVEFQPIWFDAVGVLCLVGGVFWMIRAFGAGVPSGGGLPPRAPRPGGA
jgi:hypothetical protein